MFLIIWRINMHKTNIKTIGPIYVSGLFCLMLFIIGYYNVVYKVDGLIILNVLMAICLFIQTIYSVFTYIRDLKGE